MLAVPVPTLIYHITAIENLPKIVEDGGLHCKSGLVTTAYKDIAHANIQGRRSSTAVPCGKKGSLHDYVPFYFAPRSPMLYVISTGSNYTNGQDGIVYLISTAQAVRKAGLDFVFTDGHGTMKLTQFFTSLSHLDKIDWQVMAARYWRDTQEDGDRCRRRQAEFLVHDFFPLSFVQKLAVLRPKQVAKVRTIVGTECPSEIVAAPEYYY